MVLIVDVDVDDDDNDSGDNLDYLGWGVTKHGDKFDDMPEKLLKIQVGNSHWEIISC